MRGIINNGPVTQVGEPTTYGSLGPVAQLVARPDGIGKVRGSNPLGSTEDDKPPKQVVD